MNSNEEFQKTVLEEFKKLNERIGNLEQGQAKLLQRQENLEQGQAKLLQRQENLEKGQAKLLQRQENLEQGQAKLLQRQENLEQGQAKLLQRQENLEKGQDAIKKDLKDVIAQTADLTEFRAEMNARLDKIIRDVSSIEIITSKNWNDLARLKSVK